MIKTVYLFITMSGIGIQIRTNKPCCNCNYVVVILLNPHSDVLVAIHLSRFCFCGGGGSDPTVIGVISTYVC